jgi:hypothetical protein
MRHRGMSTSVASNHDRASAPSRIFFNLRSLPFKQENSHFPTEKSPLLSYKRGTFLLQNFHFNKGKIPFQ